MTQTGYISFFSDAPIEDIEAKNNSVSSVLNAETGKVMFKVQVKKFEFPNKTMQEHFNENYMETEKFPESNFDGTIKEVVAKGVDFKKAGSYPVTITGKLTMHGVTKDVSVPGTLVIAGDQVTGTAKFNIKVKDYNIKVPSMYVKNIAEEVVVTVKMNYTKFS